MAFLKFKMWRLFTKTFKLDSKAFIQVCSDTFHRLAKFTIFIAVPIGLLEGPPHPDLVQEALNDLPTIFPFSVSVALVGSAYRVTFPVDMGDVSSLTIISTAYTSPQNATERVRGLGSGLRLAFRLNGLTTNYLNFGDADITNETLKTEFMSLSDIRCPPSINNAQATPSIMYVNDFEVTRSYDDPFTIRNMAFCGRSALTDLSQPLVIGNPLEVEYMCFAYKIPTGSPIVMDFDLQNDGNPPITEHIPLTLRTDGRWHYKCIALRDMLEDHSLSYLTVTSFVINRVSLSSSPPAGGMIDTVTLRSSLPIGYEESEIIYLADQSSTGPCTFPFTYNGRNYSTCILDEAKLPICGSTLNQKIYCQNSSIEGVRRLYPNYQFLSNSLSVTHLPTNRMIDIVFRYTACMSPSLVEILPPGVSYRFF